MYPPKGGSIYINALCPEVEHQEAGGWNNTQWLRVLQWKQEGQLRASFPLGPGSGGEGSVSILEFGAEEMGSVPSRPRRDEDHLYLENQSLV